MSCTDELYILVLFLYPYSNRVSFIWCHYIFMHHAETKTKRIHFYFSIVFTFLSYINLISYVVLCYILSLIIMSSTIKRVSCLFFLGFLFQFNYLVFCLVLIKLYIIVLFLYPYSNCITLVWFNHIHASCRIKKKTKRFHRYIFNLFKFLKVLY